MQHTAARPHRPPPRRLRRGLHRARLRLHRAHRPRRHRRHHARPGHRQRVPPAALHDAHPRRAGQPRLPRGRRRRRPALGDPPRPWSARSPPPTSSSRSWPATTPSGPRPACCASRPTPPPGSAEAAQRYLDASTSPPRTSSAPTSSRRLDDARSTSSLPGLADEAAWPTLRAHLMLLGASGDRPGRRAAGGRERPGARHRRRPRRRAGLAPGRLRAAQRRRRAAAVDARRPEAPGRAPALGRLPRPARRPGRPSSPTRSATRRHRPATVAAGLGAERAPARRRTRSADVEVWRAAMQVAADDRRPTGAPQLQKASAHLAAAAQPARRRRPHPGAEGMAPPAPRRSPRRSAATSSPRCWPNGWPRCPAPASPPTSCSRAAAAAGPLPDDHAAAALWWRMARHLTPAVAAQIGDGSHGEGVTTDLGSTAWPTCSAPSGPARIQASTWWPALVTNVDHGLQRGWQLEAPAGGRRQPMPSATTSTSARRWCGAPRSRSSRSPTSTRTTTTSTTPPEDMWDGVEPHAEPASSTTPRTLRLAAAAPSRRPARRAVGRRGRPSTTRPPTASTRTQ